MRRKVRRQERREEGKNVQLKKGIRDLKHKHVGMVMLMTDQDSLTGPSHAMLLVMLFQPFQPVLDRRILFRLSLFRAKRVVAERVQTDGFRLLLVEGQAGGWEVGGLLVFGRDGGHV